MSDPGSTSPLGDAVVTPRLTALESVRARLLLAIEIGTLAPGDRIVPARAFAGGMDVSEITARRALESLVEDGVLVRRRGRGGGTFVADEPTRPDSAGVDAYRADAVTVRLLIDRRLLMECGLAALAADHATADDLDAIARAVDVGDAAANWASFHRADLAFHRAVAAAAHTDAAGEYLAVLTRLHAYFVPYPIEHLRESNEQHRGILHALRGRDASGAVAVTRTHVESLSADMFIAGTRLA